jgi:CRP-like cAMP-binding protein
VVAADTTGRVFPDADHALEWAENHLIEGVRASVTQEGEYPFVQLDLLQGFSTEEREAFRALLERREYRRGETVVREGAEGDELYIIARGSASAKLKIDGGREYRLGTFAAGTAFGEVAMLDRQTRSATIEADEPLVCYVLTRPGYDRIVRDMSEIAIKLLTNLGRELSARLRRANRMLNQLER